MANIEEAFNAKIENHIKLNHTDDIDHFFTQRKVSEYEEYLDKNMNRKKRKKDIIYNFIAINVPYYQYINNETLEIKANIWGDEGFKYIGVFNNTEGYVPSILLRLGADKQLFINLKVVVKNGDEKNEKEYVTFVTIPKRYQVEPKTNINKLKDKN